MRSHLFQEEDAMVRRRQTQLLLSQVVLFGTVIGRLEDLMDSELRRIDEALDDEALVDEVLGALQRRWPRSSCRGRHGTPAEVVLRLLVLRHLRNWSYEVLVREVTGSLVYRRFCRIEAGHVPEHTTLIKVAKLVSGTTLDALMTRVVQIAAERGVTKGRRMRVDTTVVEAHIHHPTDSGLCEDAARVLSRGLRRLAGAGIRLGFRVCRVSRSVSRRMREIAQAVRLRGDRARAAIKRPYKRLLRIVGRLVRQADKAVRSARRQQGRLDAQARKRAARAVARLGQVLPLSRQVIRQTRARVLRGQTQSPGKIISLFEPWAQIIRKGKLHRPTEFGAVVKVQEADGGIVTDIAIDPGKADAPLLVPAVERHIAIFGRPPDLCATDRGFYSTDGERRIQELGVRRAVIPKPGHRSESRILYEKQRWFRRGRAWRSGGEARISRLKHAFGMHGSRYRGEEGMHRSVCWAAIANNLVAIGRFSSA